MTGAGDKTGKQEWDSDNGNDVRTMRAELGQRNGNRAIDGLESRAANERTRSAAIRRLGFGRWHNGVGTWARRGSGTEISEISSGRSGTRLRPLMLRFEMRRKTN